MRTGLGFLVGSLGLTIVAGYGAAAPVIPSPAEPANIVSVSGGCGGAFHRNRHGHCVPNRHAVYRAYPRWRPYWPGYYGDGHEPWNRPTPGDHIANQLNRQQLRAGFYRPY